MSVSCPNCGSKSIDSKVKRTMYNEIVQYYECSFCRILFMTRMHIGKNKLHGHLAGLQNQ